MLWKRKTSAPAAPLSPPASARNMAEMTRRLGLDPAPAAWPAGVSLLAQAIAACERCETASVCGDWLDRAPAQIKLPPGFCPNAETFRKAKPGG